MQQKISLDNKVIVHLAEPLDLISVYALVDEYADGVDIDRNKTKNALREMVYANGVLLFEYNNFVVGGVAGYVMPSMFTDDSFFMSMFFYVRKEYRNLTKQCIKELELCILPSRITKLIFGVLALDNIKYNKQKRYFKMLGYKELETHFYKDV